MRYSVVFCAILVLAGMLSGTEGDYEKGEAAYREGAYHTAEVFFQTVLREDPHHARVPDAMFYLIKIYELREDMPALLAWVQRFLADCPYDNRRQDVLGIVMQRFLARNAYGIAYDFLSRYEFLIRDAELLEDIAVGLMQQRDLRLADSVLALCPASDTVNILRALLAETDDERRHYYRVVSGEKGHLYMMELLLATGDTVQAFEIFRGVDKKNVRDDMLFRYARIALLFDDAYFTTIIDRLLDMPQYRHTALFLRALQSGELDRSLKPQDAQECSLLIETMSRRVIPREDFSDVLGEDTISLDSIVGMIAQHGPHFMLDSLHTEKLLALGDTAGALRVIAPYVRYTNTAGYARTIRGMHFYNDHDHEGAATDFLLAQITQPETKFMLAQALSSMGIDAADLYDQVLKSTQDTVLLRATTRQLITIQFDRGEYDRVITHDPQLFFRGPEDTTVLRKYVYSLARRGERETADMWCAQYELSPDDEQANYYGEYLIDTKRFTKARTYYDSLVEASESSAFLYNWALVPFMRGDLDTAQTRFTFLMERHPRTGDYYRTAFKLATILYLEERFDSAASLYGIAREDTTLTRDALQNQLICYKKSGSWFKVVKTGTEILSMDIDDDEHETGFEIGYAWLRAGRPERATAYLRVAARVHPSPEYYYWLAEAYLAKADFSRALYFYRTIGDVFPGDDMWTPTALYKTGIVLEFMDAKDEAMAVYRHIIRTRGASDTWGVEAQRRIEYLEQ